MGVFVIEMLQSLVTLIELLELVSTWVLSVSIIVFFICGDPDITRDPLVRDDIWTETVIHFNLKCAKTSRDQVITSDCQEFWIQTRVLQKHCRKQ